MQLYKNSMITVRIPSILKDKFLIANGFLELSSTISAFMQNTVREYEKQYGIIPIKADSNGKYDIITKMFGVKINRDEFDYLQSLYPKTRKGICLVGDSKKIDSSNGNNINDLELINNENVDPVDILIKLSDKYPKTIKSI